MQHLFYFTKYIHVIYTLASHLRDEQGNGGQSGVDVSKRAGYAVCDGNMSSLFCFVLFCFVFLLIAEKVTKVNKAQQPHSGGQKHNFPACKKIFKW